MSNLVSNELYGEPFELIELTNAVNRIPYKEEALATLFPWNTVKSRTEAVRINSRDGSLQVVPSTPRDGVAPTRHGDKAKGQLVEIPGYAERGTIMNREIFGAQQGLDGEEALVAIEELRNERLALINGDLDVTVEHQRAKAITGTISDIDGLELANMYDIMGVDQIEFDLDLSASESLVTQLEEAKEIGEIALGGDASSVSHWVAISGKSASAKFLRNEEVKQAGTNPLHQFLTLQDKRKGTRICTDVDLVHYRRGFLEPTDCFLVPVFPGCAQTILGPSDVEDYLGNILPRYVIKELLNKRGMRLEVWTFILNYFVRPEAIIRLKIAGLVA